MPRHRGEKLRLLTYSSLFPNAEAPHHGVFVAERLRHLLADYPVIEGRVVAPVPWFPFRSRRFGHYGAAARIPAAESQGAIPVSHPRYPVLPKIGTSVAPALMAARMTPYLARLRDQWPFALIDAHYLYPDGIAAVIAARSLGVPVVVTARGNDLSLLPRWAVPRRWLRWCLRHTDALITVCQALADAAVALTPEVASRTHVLRNGVDLSKFSPRDRAAVRQEYGLEGFVLLSVGHHIERKGHHFVIEALTELRDATLVLAGDGEMRTQLESLARQLGVIDRVRFLGRVSQDSLADLYTGADALVLASSREGWANVLLESLACGTPVVATRVWGTPEAICEPVAGVLIDDRSAAGVATGVRQLRADYPDRGAVRAYAEQFSWAETSRGQYDIFQSLASSEARQ